MLRYPELLAWEDLWTSSLREAEKAIYNRVKSVNAKLGVGWHIWHNNSFNPIYPAEQDLAEMAPYSDFLKVVMYQNCAGERMADYINSVGSTYFSDPKQELLDFHYRVLDYGSEASLKDLPTVGFSADYVYRETKRAREALRGSKTRLWLGIDIDIPTASGNSKCTPDRTKAVVRLVEAVAFLSRICPGEAEKVGQLVLGRLSRHKLANAVAIALKAENRLADDPVTGRQPANPDLVVRILEDGSSTDEDWLKDFWGGLLATSCTVDANDQSSLIFVESFSKLTTSLSRIRFNLREAAALQTKKARAKRD